MKRTAINIAVRMVCLRGYMEYHGLIPQAWIDSSRPQP